MMKSIFFIITFVLFLSQSTLSRSPTCNKDDEKVLFKIKNSFGNPYHLASWQKGFDCRKWYSVDCDANTGRIIALTIFAGNISGKIPVEVGDLPYLQTLVLRKLPNLTGEIPSAIAKLTQLTMLRLSWTNLSGPVPSFLSKLTNLNFLDLAFNDLSGSIPPELATLKNLDALHLDRNKLTGVIPESFGEFTGKVPDLYLSHNQLTGPLPKSLGYINFSTIDFSRNQITGDISMFFGTNKTIERSDFSRNMLEFNLSGVVFPASLSSLDLNHNKIYGSLPAMLTELHLNLNVSYNRLCGQIPQGGDLQTFDTTTYFHNRCLCGSPLPACK